MINLVDVHKIQKWSAAAHILHTFEIEVITSDKIPRSAMTKFSLVRQFEIFSMVSWAVAYKWGHTPYDIQIFPYTLQTAKPHYVECSARNLHNLRPVDNAYPKLTVAQQHLHTILGVESSR